MKSLEIVLGVDNAARLNPSSTSGIQNDMGGAMENSRPTPTQAEAKECMPKKDKDDASPSCRSPNASPYYIAGFRTQEAGDSTRNGRGLVVTLDKDAKQRIEAAKANYSKEVELLRMAK